MTHLGITYEMVKSLEAGESIYLADNHELYHYLEDEVIILLKDDKEVATVLHNDKTKKVEFEIL